MNKFILSLIFITNLSLSALGATNDPNIVAVEVTKGFLPTGFDDNDRVQVTVQGTLPSTCYKVGPAKAVVNSVEKTITIAQDAYQYRGPCIQILVPFTNVIDVGIVPKGNYAIVDGLSTKFLGTLPVVASTNPGPDDYLYAPITDAYVTKEALPVPVLVLTGSFPDTCFSLKETKVHYYKDVLVVQPIADRTETRTCLPIKQKFQETIELREDVHGEFLLHVRSMNGQAINKIIELE